MALSAYLRLTATRHGPVAGSCTQKGREGRIVVNGLYHQIVSPRDPVSGRPTGKRAHKPLIVTKEVDRSSPLLYAVLTTNENIAEWELQCWQPSPTGIERQHFTIRLTHANICSIHFRQPSTRHARESRLPLEEEVAFTYRKIEWTWTEGGLSAADDWETPR
jgi:type VI secretion system secreted protein Hcp